MKKTIVASSIYFVIALLVYMSRRGECSACEPDRVLVSSRQYTTKAIDRTAPEYQGEPLF